MSTALADDLRRDLSCEDLLECVHGLSDLDRACFRVVASANEPLTIDDIAAEVDRERSTVYRAVHRLVDTGFLSKEQVNYDQGGYYHVYRPVDPGQVAEEMESLIDQWHDRMTDLISEFRREYGDELTVESRSE